MNDGKINFVECPVPPKDDPPYLLIVQVENGPDSHLGPMARTYAEANVRAFVEGVGNNTILIAFAGCKTMNVFRLSKITAVMATPYDPDLDTRLIMKQQKAFMDRKMREDADGEGWRGGGDDD